MNNRRSASVGALPLEKKHFVSRNESASGTLLDVRCACQYFQCETLLPDRVNPVESRPTSKQGFVSEMEHGDHHFDNVSTGSFNMMARHPEFDRMSAASFGGRGLVVRSISDAKDPDMVAGGMMAGFRGRQMSIGSFGGRDPDAVSIRSGISLRRVSRSPSHADLFVADLNIPTPHMVGHSRRGSRGEIPTFNVVAPTPTPTTARMAPPDFNIYDKKGSPYTNIRTQQFNNTPRWPVDNKENLMRHREQILPQNKPIDVSRYGDRNESGRIISTNEPMDVDLNIIEAVVDIKDHIRIDRMSPPLEQNVPDLSPKVENEKKIEISDFAPQPDLRSIEAILADDQTMFEPELNANRPTSPSSFSLLKRQHNNERDLSPDYSKKHFMQRGSPTNDQSYQRPSPTAPPLEDQNYGSSQFGIQSYQRETSPAPTSSHFTDTRQHIQRSPHAGSFKRSPSPGHADAKHFDHYSGKTKVAKSFQKASSPVPISANTQQIDLNQRESPSGINNLDTSRSFQRASSPEPVPMNERQRQLSPQPASSFQRASSRAPATVNERQFVDRDLSPQRLQSLQRSSAPAPTGMQQMNDRQLGQREMSPKRMQHVQSFQRASSPVPTNVQGRQFLQRGSPLSEQFDVELKVHDKKSYSSRFMSMFHSKTSSDTALHEKQTRGRSPSPGKQLRPETLAKRKLSVGQLLHFDRNRSPSPEKQLKVDSLEKGKLSVGQVLHFDRGRSTTPEKQLKPDKSPSPSRFMSAFKREKPEQQQKSALMSVVESSHLGSVTIRKPPEEKPHTIKVTETFSLKVDEMDQYSSRPPKSPSPARQSRLYASHEQLRSAYDRLSESIDFSGDHQTPFTPVIIPTAQGHSSQTQLQAGDRSQYMSSSQVDLRTPRRFNSHEHISQPAQTFTLGNKKLVSVPIDIPDEYDVEMTSHDFIHQEPEELTSYSQPLRTNLIKAPSEQRLARSKLLQQKANVSERTQSQDRSAIDRNSELDTLSISTRSMTKTVSFNFDEHSSQLSRYDKANTSSNQLDKSHWLERTYFSR